MTGLQTMIFDDVFKNKIPLPDKLLSYGFSLDEGTYVYNCKIVDNQFDLTVYIAQSGQVYTKVIDSNTGDEYRLHLVESVVGSFIGKVRADYLDVLQKIADNCFETKIFQSEYADKIIQYVREKYRHELEYLWQKFPENAIVRRTDNQKWYLALLTVEKNKLGLDGRGKTEIIDLRINPDELKNIADGKKYFLGYHMNKKHWVTICLDGSVDLQEIFDRIDASYALAK